MERLSGEHSSRHLESDDVRLGGDSEHDGVALPDGGDGGLHNLGRDKKLLSAQVGILFSSLNDLKSKIDLINIKHTDIQT